MVSSAAFSRRAHPRSDRPHSWALRIAVGESVHQRISSTPRWSAAIICAPCASGSFVRCPQSSEGLDTSHLRFGASYDISSPLYDVLLADGFAVLDDAGDRQRCRSDE